MAGTIEGGQKAAATNKKRYGEGFYVDIGAKGGKNGKTCGILAVMSTARPLSINPKYKVLDTGVVLGLTGLPRKPQVDAKGYLRVQVRAPGKKNGVATLKLHRAVAEAFVPNPDNLPQVDHLDGDKSNNHYRNLEWVTNEENQRRAKAKGVYLKRLPDNILKYGGQIITAIESGYVATDLFGAYDIERKTFWSAVENGRISPQPLTTLKTGRKKKYYYFDSSRNKWRVERSDAIPLGKQFDTEREARLYAEQSITGGFASHVVDKNGLTGPQRASIYGAEGGKTSRRTKKIGAYMNTPHNPESVRKTKQRAQLRREDKKG